MLKEVSNDLKEYIDYMFLTECEKIKKAYDGSYVEKTYARPSEEKIIGFPLIYKTYILDKIAEIESEIE